MALAMAGGKTPWGDADADPDAARGAGSGGEPDKKPGGDNPWAPPGSEGPPRRSASIEDIFRQRGGGEGSGGGGFRGLPPRPGGKSWTPLIAFGVVAAWLLGTSFHQLGQNEQGIVTTFGKYSHTLGAGVSMTAPWPLQSVAVRDVTRINQITIPENESEKLMLTSDQALVDLSYQVRWNVKDLKQFSFELNDPIATVQEVAEAAMRASVAEVPLNAVWGGSGRGELQDNVRRRMQAVLDAYRSGVQVLGVEIKKADPPAKVADAFQKVNAAQQDAQRDQANAEAWAQQKVAIAQGEAAAFDKVYDQYKLAPEVTRRRLYYETMERVLSNNDKVVVETNGVTPYLPLPAIRRKPQVEVESAPRAGGGQ